MLAALDAEIRHKLDERAEWLTGAKLMARDEISVRWSVWNSYQADNIQKHCAALILEITGASRLDFEIEPAAAAQRRRR